MNYCELLLDTQESDLDLEALIDGENGKRLTYRELIEEVKKLQAFWSQKVIRMAM
jgi:long-chain acyl-CoA synthetase